MGRRRRRFLAPTWSSGARAAERAKTVAGWYVSVPGLTRTRPAGIGKETPRAFKDPAKKLFLNCALPLLAVKQIHAT